MSQGHHLYNKTEKKMWNREGCNMVWTVRGLLTHITVSITWIVIAGLWGILMTAVGPGIIMVFIAGIVGCCGTVYSLVEYFMDLQLSSLVSALIVASFSTLVTFIFFSWGNYSLTGIVFYFVANLIPCVLSILSVKKIWKINQG